MSVALFGTLNKQSEIYYPLSTEKVYQEVVLPIVHEKNLFWLTQLRTGFPIDKNNASEILSELEVLLVQIQIKQPDYYLFFNSRIEPICACLNRLSELAQFDLYFG